MSGVYTRSYNNYRDGCQTNETYLTSSHVQSNGVRVKWVYHLDDPRGTEGAVLIADSVTVRGGTKTDLALIADMSGMIYGYDAHGPKMWWKQPLARPITITRNEDMYLINPYWFALSTGVYDPDTQTWYIVGYTSPNGTIKNAAYFFYSINVADGSDRHPPIPLNGVTYKAPSGSIKTLGSAARKQRPALTLINQNGKKAVLIPFGTFAESSAANLGWVVAVDVTNSPVVNAAVTTGDKHPGPGIWMAGGGLSVGDNGRIYGMTGNGGFDPPGDLGECLFAMEYTGTALDVVDWWSPYSDAGRAGDDPTLPMPTSNAPDDMGMGDMPVNASNGPTSNVHKVGDQDLGSGAPLFLPKSIFGTDVDILMGAGKDGLLNILDANNMGKTQPGDFRSDKISGNYARLLSPVFGYTYYPGDSNLQPTQLDELPVAYGGYTRHLHGQPRAYLSPDHGLLTFCHGENERLRAISISPSGKLTYIACGTEYASSGMQPPGGMPGGMTTLTCSGQRTNTGIIWDAMPGWGDANKTITPGRFVGYAANWVQNGNLIKVFDSADWNWKYSHNKFCEPTGWSGTIYLPTYDGTVLAIG